MKKLSYWIITGQSRFKPKLKWKEESSGCWRTEIAGKPYSYLVEFKPPEKKGNVAVWNLLIESSKKNERMDLIGHSELAMVYSSVAAMAIAELIEAKENEFVPYETTKTNLIFVGREQRDLNDFSWETEGNYAYYQEGAKGYELLRNKGSEFWNLRIIFPGGADTAENCDNWELKIIDSLRIGQAIVALMAI
jgi:hypothetical protein